MKKLKNPYADYPEYNCFGCSPSNDSGLRMEFFEDDDEIVSIWKPGLQYQGYHDVLHGGIQATMIDEIASRVVFMKLDTAGVTYRLNIRYREPVMISKGSITIRARLLEDRRKIASIGVDLMDGEGNKCSEGTVDYFILPREQAEREFHFPGKEAFLL